MEESPERTFREGLRVLARLIARAEHTSVGPENRVPDQAAEALPLAMPKEKLKRGGL